MNPNERIQYLEELLQNDPNDPFLSYALAIEYLQLNNFNDGIEMLEALRFDNPTYIPTYYKLASVYIEQGQHDKARMVIEEGLNLTKGKDQKTYSELQSLLDEID